jgi:hypothetical protein
MADPQTQTVEFEGQQHQFPADFTDAEIQQALSSHGQAPTQPAQPTEASAWDTTKNFGKNVYQGAKGAVTGAYDLGKDLATNPNWLISEPGQPSTFKKFVSDPADAEMVKSAQLNKEGRPWEAAGHSTAAMIPFAGPWAASLGEQAGKGDISGAAGQLVGGLGASKLVGKTAETAIDLPKNMVDFIRRAGSPEAVTKSAAGVYQGEVQPAVQKLQGAIKAEGARTIQQAIEADKAATQGMPMKGTISTAPAVAEAAKTIEETGHLPTAQTQAVLSRLTNDPMLSLEDAKNLRSDIGEAAAKAERGGNAKLGKILWSAYDQLGEGVKGRITELSGTPKPYEHYNNEFTAYYELNKGIAGSMQDSIMDRHEAIPKLRDFAAADLTEMKEQAGKYGLKPEEFDTAQQNAKSVVSAYDSVSGKFNKTLMRLYLSGGLTGAQIALPLAVLAVSKGAGLYGLAPFLLASYVGAKMKGLEPQMETGRILRKLNVNPDAFQVRTPVEGPKNFSYPNQDDMYNPQGGQSQPPVVPAGGGGEQPQTAGSKAGAVRDTQLFQQARKELGPKASLSDVAQRAAKLSEQIRGIRGQQSQK